MSNAATLAARMYDDVLKELTKDLEVTLMQAVDGSGLEKVKEIKATALGITQSLLIAQSIESTLSDLGPLISTAINNVSERLS